MCQLTESAQRDWLDPLLGQHVTEGSSPATGTINYCHGDYNSVLRSQGSTYLTKGNRPDLTIWTVFFYAFSTCQQRLTVLK